MIMLTITQDFLTKYPSWALAGWRVGDECDFTLLPPQTQAVIAAHPPHKPGT